MRLSKEEIEAIISDKAETMQKEYGKKAYMLLQEILTFVEKLNGAEKRSRIIPVPDWDKFHTYPTVSAIRNYINKANKNGFDKVFFKKGVKNFIVEDEMFRWLQSERKNVNS